MKVSLEWLKDFVDLKRSPEKTAEMLTMGGLEVEGMERSGKDVIFELGVTPNRADCLSIVGVAREIAAIAGCGFSPPAVKAPDGSGKMAEFVKISVKHPRRCPRYSARIIDGVKIGPSPSWIIKRLAACGVRSINNVVDATNYVMLETGQPLHAFDTRFIKGNRIIVKELDAQLSFRPLDGTEKKLIPGDLMICDSEDPLALAGIMGGENSEVRQSTTRVLLESAFFDPSGVRRTSRRLGLGSESSKRFERGVDPNGTLYALHRLVQIIIETGGGVPTSDWIDIYPRKIAPVTISITVCQANRILGTSLTAVEIKKCLSGLGLSFRATGKSSQKITCVVPTFRRDLTRSVDLIEEIGRTYGYENIGETMPQTILSPVSKPKFFDSAQKARDLLVAAGFAETVLYGFTSEESLKPFKAVAGEPIRISNPLSGDQSVMRTSLLPGLLDVMKLNISRQRCDLRVFSLQGVYHRQKSAGPILEPSYLAIAMTGHRYSSGWDRASEMLDFYDIKGAVDALFSSMRIKNETVYQRGDSHGFLHPGRFASIIVSGRLAGFVGMLHPDVAGSWNIDQEVFVAELDFELISKISFGGVTKFSELSKFPFVDRDLSLVVPERVPAVLLEKAISDSNVGILDEVRIFDVYRGGGVQDEHKSIAVSIRFADNQRTLTDEEVDKAQLKILNILQTRLGATLRT